MQVTLTKRDGMTAAIAAAAFMAGMLAGASWVSHTSATSSQVASGRNLDIATLNALYKAQAQRDLCLESFNVATVIYDKQESVNLPGTLGTAVSVAPGTMVPLAPKWWIPAKITPRLMHASAQPLNWEWVDGKTHQVVNSGVAEISNPRERFRMGQPIGEFQQ